MPSTLSELNEQIIQCRHCPRLVAWREEVARVKRRAYADWDYWGRPVPGFGDEQAWLLIVGLAPGAHGANRTGRVFTGDDSGNFFYPTLYRTGFANQPTGTHREDGLRLTGCYVSCVARCVPPQNRPSADEMNACRPYLAQEMRLLPRLEAILALGGLAFDHVQRALHDLGYIFPKLAFGHGVHYDLTEQAVTVPDPAPLSRLPRLSAAYHPSRQNTNTGRLTAAMFEAVFAQVKAARGT